MEEKKGSSSVADKSKYVLGFVTGMAVSFMVAFGFVTFIASDLVKINLAAIKNTDTAVVADTAAAEPPSFEEELAAAAKIADINAKKIDKCVNDGKYVENVEEDEAAAELSGVSGTPNNIIVSGNNVAQLGGAYPREDFDKIIENFLNGTPENVELADIDFKPVNEDDWVLGNKNAPVTIIEYSDIDCPFCRRHHPTLQDIVEDYNGRVNWVYRHLPLDALHPLARSKAEATECAGAEEGNDAFWSLLDAFNES